MNLIKSFIVVLFIHSLFFLKMKSEQLDQTSISLKLSKITSTPRSANHPIKTQEVQGRVTGQQSLAANTERNSVSLETTYLDQIKNIIEEKKAYPSKAVQLKVQGVVEVEFSIAEDGKIVNLKIAGSAHEILKDATWESFQQINKFPIPPTDIASKKIFIPIEYQLQ